MNAAQRIREAEHALNTGQPMLAELYMRRAEEHLADELVVIRRAHHQARMALRSRKMSRSVAGFIEGVGETVADAFKPLTDVFDAFTYAFAHTPYIKSDYTLAGPSKGTK